MSKTSDDQAGEEVPSNFLDTVAQDFNISQPSTRMKLL